jgi:hypothetical protein
MPSDGSAESFRFPWRANGKSPDGWLRSVPAHARECFGRDDQEIVADLEEQREDRTFCALQAEALEVSSRDQRGRVVGLSDWPKPIPFGRCDRGAFTEANRMKGMYSLLQDSDIYPSGSRGLFTEASIAFNEKCRRCDVGQLDRVFTSDQSQCSGELVHVSHLLHFSADQSTKDVKLREQNPE